MLIGHADTNELQRQYSTGDRQVDEEIGSDGEKK
jgi:hypothetical protein